MKKYLLICLIGLINFQANYFTDVNVTSFGATGNGTTDDTNAINAAFASAASTHAGVFFPAGTYLCNTVDGSNHILTFTMNGDNNVSIYGQGKITTTTVNSTLLLILAGSVNSNITITGLFIESTHPTTTTSTTGLYIAGTGGQNFHNITVSYCRFEGFNTHLLAQGVDGLTVTRNQFYAPKGHDNGEQGTSPNIAFVPAANSNGYVDNLYFTNNIGIGYTGTGPITSLTYKSSQDGIYRGAAWNSIITGNRSSFYSQEHYSIQPFPSGLTPDPATHTGVPHHTYVGFNTVDCAIVPGSIDGSTPHKVNYGIRADDNSVVVDNNYIYSYTCGIMSRPADYTTTTFDSISYTNNRLFEATDTANYTVNAAFIASGTITHYTITNNQVQSKSSNPTNFSSGSIPTILTNNFYVPFNCNCFF